jgi:hypothetical protein
MPTEVYCPSRDTAGNGTTTLTGLVAGNNGTLTNMDPATDWVSDTNAGGVRALDFDGTNDYVTVPHNSVLNPGTSAFSISAWVQPDNINQFGVMAQKRNSDGGIGQVYSLAVAANGIDATAGKKIALTLLWNSISVGRSFRTTDDVADGNWHHIVAVWTGSAIKIYVDNVDMLLTSELSSGTIATGLSPSGPLRLGTNVVSGGAFFNGRQDDLRLFFSHALDASDVSALYASGAGRGISL